MQEKEEALLISWSVINQRLEKEKVSALLFRLGLSDEKSGIIQRENRWKNTTT